MPDSLTKIFLWQLVIAAVVGVFWFVLWELTSVSEEGFFFDFPWGLVQGFVGGIVVLLILGAITIAVAKDSLVRSPFIVSLNDTLDSWNTSGPVMGIEWALKVAIGWGLAGGIVWGLETDYVVSLAVVAVFGVLGALVLVWASGVTETLAGSIEQGYSWLEGLLSGLRGAFGFMGDAGFIGFLGAVAWGVGGLIAAGGLGSGSSEAIVLGVVALIAAVIGGIIGAQFKTSPAARLTEGAP